MHFYKRREEKGIKHQILHIKPFKIKRVLKKVFFFKKIKQEKMKSTVLAKRLDMISKCS